MTMKSTLIFFLLILFCGTLKAQKRFNVFIELKDKDKNNLKYEPNIVFDIVIDNLGFSTKDLEYDRVSSTYTLNLPEKLDNTKATITVSGISGYAPKEFNEVDISSKNPSINLILLLKNENKLERYFRIKMLDKDLVKGIPFSFVITNTENPIKDTVAMDGIIYIYFPFNDIKDSYGRNQLKIEIPKTEGYEALDTLLPLSDRSTDNWFDINLTKRIQNGSDSIISKKPLKKFFNFIKPSSNLEWGTASVFGASLIAWGSLEGLAEYKFNHDATDQKNTINSLDKWARVSSGVLIYSGLSYGLMLISRKSESKQPKKQKKISINVYSPAPNTYGITLVKRF